MQSSHIITSLYKKQNSKFFQLVTGLYTKKIHSHGSEFHSISQYHPGDNPKYIHWRSYLTSGHLMKKDVYSDVSKDIFVYITPSHSWNFGSNKQLKKDTLLECIWLIGICCEALGDNFALAYGGGIHSGNKGKIWYTKKYISKLEQDLQKEKNTIDSFPTKNISNKTIFVFSDKPFDPINEQRLEYLERKNTIYYISIYDSSETKKGIIPKNWGKFHLPKKLPESDMKLDEKSNIYRELCLFFSQEVRI